MNKTNCKANLCLFILITLNCDVGKNPEPQQSSCDKFSICQWNLNNILAHNSIKISLIRAYISTHNFDILCLSETYLDSSISSSDNNLTIPGYDLNRADHPSNVKHGVGFCIYFKKFFPLNVIDLISTRLHQLRNANRGKIM